MQVPVEATFRWGQHAVDLSDYDRIWATRNSLVVRKGNTTYAYSKNGSMIIHRPDGSIENHENGFITVTKDDQTLAFKVKSYQYQPKSSKETTPFLYMHSNGVVSLIASDYVIIGPKLGQMCTRINFTDYQDGKRTLCMKGFN